jgi:hypothetical protein
MRIAGWALAVALVIATAAPAQAQQLVAVRPGVMCTSAAALALLTMPNGDSRTHSPSATQQDRNVASDGGCIDIPLGAAVVVEQGFKNTSIASYGGTRLTIPNIDFQPVAASAPVPASRYALAQPVPVGGTGTDTLEILEDARIDPALRKLMWHVSDDPSMLFPANSPDAHDYEQPPLQKAALRLMSPQGAVLAQRPLDEPLARIEPTPLTGLPTPTFLLTVDRSTGVGSYSGPATELLTPTAKRLEPVTFVTSAGTAGGPITLWSTGKADWRVIPSPAGGPATIEAVSSRPDAHGGFVTNYTTFSFSGGQWRSATRETAGLWESGVFPAPDAFP